MYSSNWSSQIRSSGIYQQNLIGNRFT